MLPLHVVDVTVADGGSTNTFKQQSTAPTQDSSKEPKPLQSAATYRRQQVYQAQKRHRDRKADYVQSLEAEIAVS